METLHTAALFPVHHRDIVTLSLSTCRVLFCAQASEIYGIIISSDCLPPIKPLSIFLRSLQEQREAVLFFSGMSHQAKIRNLSFRSSFSHPPTPPLLLLLFSLLADETEIAGIVS